MEKIKRAYCYLFYKLYKMSEVAPSKWWSEWKASLAMDVLIFFFLFSCLIYYAVFIDKYTKVGGETTTIWILGILILVPNYFIFHYKDKWRDIVSDFDKLPEKKNKRGGIIVWTFIFLIIANLIFAFYLMSQVDWSQYR